MAQLRGRFNNTDKLARTLNEAIKRATDDPFQRTRRVLASGGASAHANNIAGQQIVAIDFRTARNVGIDAGGVLFNSDGIEGYNSSLQKTFDIGTDGSGFLGLGATQITWATSGAVAVPGDGLVAGSVTGAKIANDTITSALLKAGAQPYNSTVLFTGTAYNSYEWSSGNIAFADSATQAINSGSNSGLSDNTTYYVYATIGSATLTQTTTYSDVFSDSRILLAIIVVGTSSSGSAPTILPFASRVPTISAVAIAANSITADHIQAGTITANKITVTAISDIDPDLGSITAGTITGGTIRSAASGQRVEITSAGLMIHGTPGGGPITQSIQFKSTAGGSTDGYLAPHGSGGVQIGGDGRFNEDAVPTNSGSGNVGTSSEQWAGSAIQTMTANVITHITQSTGLQFHTSAGSNKLGFFGATPVTKPNVSGSRGGNAALADLITELANLGLIADSTT